MLLALPAAVALFVARQPFMIGLFVYPHGAFHIADAIASGGALAAYAAGIPAYVLAKVLSTAYFAREDTRTPLKFSLITIALNTALVLLMVFAFGYGIMGIAAATGATAWLNVALLGLGALAATSTDAMIKRLGALRWNRLHKLIYLIAALAIFHFYLQSKVDVSEPVLMMGFYFILMIYRLLQKRGLPAWAVVVDAADCFVSLAMMLFSCLPSCAVSPSDSNRIRSTRKRCSRHACQ